MDTLAQKYTHIRTHTHMLIDKRYSNIKCIELPIIKSTATRCLIGLDILITFYINQSIISTAKTRALDYINKERRDGW